MPTPAVDEPSERVSEKISYQLAQRPASYVILKYVRPGVKAPADGRLHSASAPDGVFGTSPADVSFIAGWLSTS